MSCRQGCEEILEKKRSWDRVLAPGPPHWRIIWFCVLSLPQLWDYSNSNKTIHDLPRLTGNLPRPVGAPSRAEPTSRLGCAQDRKAGTSPVSRQSRTCDVFHVTKLLGSHLGEVHAGVACCSRQSPLGRKLGEEQSGAGGSQFSPGLT